MELKEFMEREKLSEDDIIKAASIVTKVCKNGSCKNCPLFLFENCYAKGMTEDFKNATSRRFQELLHPSHMEKVAKMLGVKLGEKFVVATPISDVVNTYHLTKQGIFGEDNMSAEITLSNLLTGNAHIIKGEI